MNFQNLTTIENPETYIDVAFKSAEAAGASKRREFVGKEVNKLIRSRVIEITKIKALTKTAAKLLENIVANYPSIDGLDPFYLALVKCTIDYAQLKQSLGAMAWGAQMLHRLGEDAERRIRATRQLEYVNKHRQAFYGRAASVFKQIKKNLAYLEEARKIMKKYPPVKTGIPTIVIAGAPNVGKSSLLAALTGSAPRVAPYPFTTQQLMLGYFETDSSRIQIIDTPGLLDRPLEKRNPIEKQAILALKHLAKAIIFVLDPTEACGYSFQEQLHLLAEMKKEFQIPVLVVANKTDLPYEKKLAEDTLLVSVEKKLGIEELKERVIKIISA
ncbi:MAG: 50S ribosome-binding GTPase [Candidatus Aenigmarchaeota archaeon]|nr:50S ribosome-binding GTPase [Candidatus Aenigmarchaeota archaeon]